MTASGRSRITGLVRPCWRLAQRGRAQRQARVVVSGSLSCYASVCGVSNCSLQQARERDVRRATVFQDRDGVGGIREDWFQSLIFGPSRVLPRGAAPTAVADVLP